MFDCFVSAGGNEQRQAQLGALKRRLTRAHHSRRHTGSGWVKTTTGGWWSQETTCPRS